MKKTISILAAAAAVALATSCSGVKNCAPPQLDLPDHIAGNYTDSMTIADIEWWQVYTDSSLVNIIQETLANNRDFLAAGARVEQARELYGITKADFFPTISAQAYGDYETNDYHGEKSVRDPEYGLKATISWEADIWGGLKWARRKGMANYIASVEEWHAMQMTLIAEVAASYYRLIALDNELSIVRRSLATREENVRMAKLRFEGGVTSELVYRQAIVEFSTTAALVPALENRIKVAQNAISLLMGRYPEEELARSRMWVEKQLPDDLPVGLPSTLLKRRPDIRAAEQKMKASLASVGVAYADRFPSIRIAFTGGLENNDLAGFLKSPFTYTIGQLAGTVFDFGRKKKQYKAAIAAYDQSRYAYEKSVLAAFHEVDNAIDAFRRARQSTVLKRELREAALKYVDLAHIQYRAGSIAYIDVLDAQRRFFEAQIGLGNAVRDEHLAFVDLYRALGGGF